MTNTDTTTTTGTSAQLPCAPQAPNLEQQIAQALARHALTALAGILVAQGAIAKSQQQGFIEIGSAVAVWLIGVAWSTAQKVLARQKFKAAVNAVPPPVASVLLNAANTTNTNTTNVQPTQEVK